MGDDVHVHYRCLKTFPATPSSQQHLHEYWVGGNHQPILYHCSVSPLLFEFADACQLEEP